MCVSGPCEYSACYHLGQPQRWLAMIWRLRNAGRLPNAQTKHSGKLDERKQINQWELQPEPDMPGIQRRDQINSGSDLCDIDISSWMHLMSQWFSSCDIKQATCAATTDSVSNYSIVAFSPRELFLRWRN